MPGAFLYLNNDMLEADKKWVYKSKMPCVSSTQGSVLYADVQGGVITPFGRQ